MLAPSQRSVSGQQLLKEQQQQQQQQPNSMGIASNGNGRGTSNGYLELYPSNIVFKVGGTVQLVREPDASSPPLFY